MYVYIMIILYPLSGREYNYIFYQLYDARCQILADCKITILFIQTGSQGEIGQYRTQNFYKFVDFLNYNAYNIVNGTRRASVTI